MLISTRRLYIKDYVGSVALQLVVTGLFIPPSGPILGLYALCSVVLVHLVFYLFRRSIPSDKDEGREFWLKCSSLVSCFFVNVVTTWLVIFLAIQEVISHWFQMPLEQTKAQKEGFKKRGVRSACEIERHVWFLGRMRERFPYGAFQILIGLFAKALMIRLRSFFMVVTAFMPSLLMTSLLRTTFFMTVLFMPVLFVRVEHLRMLFG